MIPIVTILERLNEATYRLYSGYMARVLMNAKNSKY